MRCDLLYNFTFDYGYTQTDIVLRLQGDKPVDHSKLHLPQFILNGNVSGKTIVQILETGDYSRLTVVFPFSRRIGFYATQIYIPALLVVIISWVSFWISRESAPARTLLGITTVLTMTTLVTNTNNALPKVSYVKAVDIFLGMSYFIVILALLEFAAVSYSAKKLKERKEKSKNVKSALDIKCEMVLCTCSGQGSHFVGTKSLNRVFLPNVIDKYARIIFPSSFTLFNIFYWTYFLHKSGKI